MATTITTTTATETTTSKKKAPKPKKPVKPIDTKAGPVRLDLVDEATVESAMRELGLSTAGLLEDKVRLLAEHYAGIPAAERLICDPGCGMPSVEADAFCPGCGKSDDDEPDEKPAAKPNGNGKAVAPFEARAEVVAGPLGDYSVGDLDAQVARVKSLAAETGQSMHKLGSEIRKLHDTEVWKLRTVDGKPKFRTFKQFCAEELGFSHSWTYQLMDIADAFTEQQVAQFGATKLALALKAPEHKRGEVVAQIKGGASTADVTALVERFRAREKGSTAPDPTPREKRATSVVIKPGRKTLPLWKKAAKGEELIAAKRLADEPWTELQLDNDVRLLARVVQIDGELKLVVEFRRMAVPA